MARTISGPLPQRAQDLGKRAILGVGLGDDASDAGFAPVGDAVDRVRRAELLDEGLDLLVRLWSGKPFSYRGKHYRVDDVTCLPVPFQTPRIPIWVGGFWPRKGPIRRAARRDGVCPAGGDLSPADLGVLGKMIRTQRDSSEPFDIVIGGSIYGLDSDQARSKCVLFAEAGAAWWIEFVHPVAGDFAAIERRITHGPPPNLRYP